VYLDTTFVLVSFDGAALRAPPSAEHPKGSDLTLRNVCCQVLTSQVDPKASGQKKADQFRLATRMFRDDVVEVTAEDVALLKDLIGKGFGPLAVGPAYDALEGGAHIKMEN